MTTELIRQEQALAPITARFQPVMSLDLAIQRHETIAHAMQRMMHAQTDYGVIPGTGQNSKPTLLQPGADKLCNLFGLVPTFDTVEKVLDWNGAGHNGEAFFYYEIKCKLFREDFLMGEGIGSASSWESKYRYRKADRTCPHCGAAAIIKGKEQYGGGWVCFKNKGGCSAKFKDGDPVIEGQQTGRVPNPDIADQLNTILKMAQKRAYIAATLRATSAHEFFTQDIEDTAPASEPAPPPEYDEPPARQNVSRNQASASNSAPAAQTVVNADPEEKDPDVLALWSMIGTKVSSIRNAFEQYRKSMLEISGSDEMYDQILFTNGMRDTSPEEIKRVGMAVVRATIREVWLTNKKWVTANTPPPADSPEEEPMDAFDAHMAEVNNA